MMTTTRRRTKRIATRKVDGGYRVAGRRKTYHSFAGAFQEAWRLCLEQNADLYAITPEGKWIIMLDAKSIRACEPTNA